ncbi:MAG: aspartate kinase [Candidatus Krumholzibacteriia bacterium]
MTQAPRTASRILVRKYGGSSLADVGRIRAVAADLRRTRDDGWRLVVVVSAMGDTTDELESLARAVHPHPPRRELDMLLSVGERITMSLLSMALTAEGCPAISYTGSQIGLITDTSHTDARIVEVQGDRVRAALAAGKVVVVAGFQGVSLEKEITTLGRGGSDTTAVAIAAALGAERCEILKDVDGVLSADPRLVAAARRHERLSYAQMLDIAADGCGVVHQRAVEFAARHRVPLFVGSSLHEGPGTTISDDAQAERGAERGAAAGDRAPSPAALAPIETARPFDEPPISYRPLALTRREPVTWLVLQTIHPSRAAAWRAAVTDAGSDLPGPLLAEWLDAGSSGSLTAGAAADALAEGSAGDGGEPDRFRWEAVAEHRTVAALLERLHAAAPPGPGEERVRPKLACLSLVGGRPTSWIDVQERVAAALTPWPDLWWHLRCDGAQLRLLVPAGTPPAIPEAVHAALF